ncbi:MAG: type II toxin-antitoxin system RelE/ParE family toxin [Anaerolineae bacterium]|nr:type II toxin-antitoxin system RelE/ParE family toxin [Anaerolineae bacterium]
MRVGDYRIRYQIDDEQVTIYIIDCDHRKDVYRD